jgi:hypothetical protein
LPPGQVSSEIVFFETKLSGQFLFAGFVSVQVESVQHRKGFLSFSVLRLILVLNNLLLISPFCELQQTCV